MRGRGGGDLVISYGFSEIRALHREGKYVSVLFSLLDLLTSSSSSRSFISSLCLYDGVLCCVWEDKCSRKFF